MYPVCSCKWLLLKLNLTILGTLAVVQPTMVALSQTIVCWGALKRSLVLSVEAAWRLIKEKAAFLWMLCVHFYLCWIYLCRSICDPPSDSSEKMPLNFSLRLFGWSIIFTVTNILNDANLTFWNVFLGTLFCSHSMLTFASPNCDIVF